MLFNSIDFAVFLPIVFAIYWFLNNRNLRIQNLLMVLASYIFYGWWDWRFLSLIIFSTVVDFAIGLQFSKTEKSRNRKFLLWSSILVNLGFLGFFKYYNFFLENFTSAFSFFGMEINARSLNIILPVGISFYTFQTLSYNIDIYRRKLEPTKDFVAFAAFVSFFPQLVAGPIERATHLLPQFYKKRFFNKALAVDGLRQMLWGLFKKVVIADNAAIYANLIFNNSDDYSGSTLIVGALFFTFQIYGDFSGYSDIAIGASRLFGFDLMKNFAFPYFSRDIAEFWRRWHISLSTWFRDYLYIPLGGSRGGVWMKIKNTFIIFIVSGFWHGPNWTFIVWGVLNAIYFLPLLLLKKNRVNTNNVSEGKLLPALKEFFQIGITFILTVLAWIVFRAENITHAYTYLSNIFSTSLFSAPTVFSVDLMIIILVFLSIEWLNRDKEHALNFKETRKKWVSVIRVGAICIVIWAIILWGAFDNKEFIYFQF